MMISLIAAMAENRVIGKDNQLPWHLPADLKHFKRLTMGKPIVMGRRTFESIGRPLPGRTNIIVTADTGFREQPGCIVAHSIEEAFEAAAEEAGSSDELMVIGGASLYEQTLPLADRIYLTLIHHGFEGQALFPHYDAREWQEIERSDHEPDERNPFAYSFTVMQRNR
jgi:dihydrofolate reductase